jgi:DNA polymerase III subunit alpha
MRDFVHIHNHSQFSIMDGTIIASELIPHLQRIGQKAFALTDHGSMMGIIDFYTAFKAAGIKLIVGCEIYSSNDLDDAEEKHRDNYHLILLAKNNTGYQNLLYLLSRANQRNYYYKPRVNNLELLNHYEGLICSTACIGGEIATRFIEGKSDEAKKVFNTFKEVFKDDFYAEIMKTDAKEQEPYNGFLINLARETKTKVIITQDCHYLTYKDYKFHQMIMATQLKMSLHQYMQGDKLIYGPDYYVKTGDQMFELASQFGVPEAVENTIEIANKCNVEIEMGHTTYPEFDITLAPDYQDFLKYKEACNVRTRED